MRTAATDLLGPAAVLADHGEEHLYRVAGLGEVDRAGQALVAAQLFQVGAQLGAVALQVGRLQRQPAAQHGVGVHADDLGHVGVVHAGLDGRWQAGGGAQPRLQRVGEALHLFPGLAGVVGGARHHRDFRRGAQDGRGDQRRATDDRLDEALAPHFPQHRHRLGIIGGHHQRAGVQRLQRGHLGRDVDIAGVEGGQRSLVQQADAVLLQHIRHDPAAERDRVGVLRVVDDGDCLDRIGPLEPGQRGLQQHRLVDGVAEGPGPIGRRRTGLGGGLAARHQLGLVGHREGHFAGAAGQRAGNGQHLVVIGQLAHQVGGLRRAGGVVIDRDAQLGATDTAAGVDLLLHHAQRHGVGAAPFGEGAAAGHDGAQLHFHTSEARLRGARTRQHQGRRGQQQSAGNRHRQALMVG